MVSHPVWITGTGKYLPERAITNAELATRVDTTDDWIRQRTGITQRHQAADGELTSDLAAAAGRAALQDAGLAAADVDLVLVATSTPDRVFPATACRVQALLGAERAAAFDLQAVCSGFVYGLATARAFIQSGTYRTVLLIGAETFTRLLDWQDRTTCVLFGDGAGAFVLQRGDDASRGLHNCLLGADGRKETLLCVDGGPSMGHPGTIQMNGREVFRHAVQQMADLIARLLQDAGLTVADLDWLVPHQANVRILEAVAEKAGMPLERVMVSVPVHANTSAASIPLAFRHGIEMGQIRPGQRILTVAMGGGFTWGGAFFTL